jgi:hypothetical protein
LDCLSEGIGLPVGLWEVPTGFYLLSSMGTSMRRRFSQLETVCLNGLRTVDLVKSLLDLVNKLSKNSTHLTSDNAFLKS